jgi:very-short-patch-repair endonuclease
LALARRQHGVVAVEQLYALGMSKDVIATLVRDGHLIRLYRGVYAVGHDRLTARGRWLAAVMACGSGSLLSHRAAAALWELGATPSGQIDVLSPSVHRLKGVSCHTCRSPHPEDGTVIDGIPVTSLARTLLDLTEILPAPRVRAVLEGAQRREILDFGRIHRLLERCNGRRGCGALRAALNELGETAPWTQSVLEQRFLELIRAAGLPEPQTNVIVDGYVVDCFWPKHDLVVELDSYGYHRSQRAFEEDRRKDAAHALAGCRSLRISRERVQKEARQLMAELRALLPARPPGVSSAA